MYIELNITASKVYKTLNAIGSEALHLQAKIPAILATGKANNKRITKTVNSSTLNLLYSLKFSF